MFHNTRASLKNDIEKASDTIIPNIKNNNASQGPFVVNTGSQHESDGIDNSIEKIK